jgi:pimeloyl-ACP methyl ester carboxylesterase
LHRAAPATTRLIAMDMPYPQPADASGAKANGPMPLLLVPGFMLDAALWDDLLPLLPATLPVQCAGLDTGATIDAMAQAVLDAAPPSFILLGFSMGGYVARAIARLAPQRVAALILVATSARADLPALVAQRVAAARQAGRTAFHGLSRGAIRMSLHAGRRDDAVLIERVRAMGERLGSDVFLRQSAVVRSGDTATLAQIDRPTLVIGADGDQLRSLDETRELAAGIPGATLAVIEGAGHLIPLEVPAALAQAIGTWLAAQGLCAPG